jgi:hypothetical protein
MHIKYLKFQGLNNLQRDTHHLVKVGGLMKSSRKISEAFGPDESWELLEVNELRRSSHQLLKGVKRIEHNYDDDPFTVGSSVYNACLGPAGYFSI